MFNQNLLHPNLCTKGHQLKQTVITPCVEVNTLFRLVECIGQQNEEENARQCWGNNVLSCFTLLLFRKQLQEEPSYVLDGLSRSKYGY